MNVLFFGTFVPLHGMDVIVEAARNLSDREDISIKFVGDGQEADEVAALLRESGNVEWLRGWFSIEEIASQVCSSDVCLGVFGGDSKAARVLPFKAYYALAAGRVMVTQAKMSLPAGLPPLPVVTSDGASVQERAAALSRQLRALADDLAMRRQLGERAATYFDEFLAGHAIADRWSELLDMEAHRDN